MFCFFFCITFILPYHSDVVATILFVVGLDGKQFGLDFDTV
jgi:hypothetical protein